MASATDVQVPAAAPAEGQAAPATAALEKAPPKAPVRYGDRGVMLTSLDDLARFATVVHQSALAPKGMDSPQKIAVAVQFGAEFGLSPMASLRAVKVINFIPSFSGDAALALVRASGKLADFSKEEIGEGDDYGYRVTTQRVDASRPMATTFTVKDAKLANLWGKSGPWSQYPKRMLYYRALGFNLRDNFADVLAGAVIAEEADDMPVSALPAGAAVAALQAGRPATVDPLMERIGVIAPEGAKPAVMPAVPASPAEEPGAAEAAAVFTDGAGEGAPCCGGPHGPAEPCPKEQAEADRMKTRMKAPRVRA